MADRKAAKVPPKTGLYARGGGLLRVVELLDGASSPVEREKARVLATRWVIREFTWAGAPRDYTSGQAERVTELVIKAIKEGLKAGDEHAAVANMAERYVAGEFLDAQLGFPRRDPNKNIEVLYNSIGIEEPSRLYYGQLNDEIAKSLRATMREMGASEAEVRRITPKVLSAFQDVSDPTPQNLVRAIANLSIQLQTYEDAVVSTALQQGRIVLSEPSGPVALYPGKREAGPIDEYLERNYPYHARRPVLTASYLRQHDPKALRAFYDLEPSKRARVVIWNEAEEGDALLRRKGIDVATEGGRAEARKVYAAIQSRVFRGMKPS